MTTLLIVGCSSDGGGLNKAEVEEPTSSGSTTHAKVDYSKGRAMNARLGKGINLGNAWDGNSYWSCGTLGEGDDFIYTINGVEHKITLTSSDKSFFGNLPAERYNYACNDGLDGGWSNPIQDEYFAFLKQAGFNSVRIPASRAYLKTSSWPLTRASPLSSASTGTSKSCSRQTRRRTIPTSMNLKRNITSASGARWQQPSRPQASLTT